MLTSLPGHESRRRRSGFKSHHLQVVLLKLSGMPVVNNNPSSDPIPFVAERPSSRLLHTCAGERRLCPIPSSSKRVFIRLFDFFVSFFCMRGFVGLLSVSIRLCSPALSWFLLLLFFASFLFELSSPLFSPPSPAEEAPQPQYTH